jgi:hypothetical protein
MDLLTAYVLLDRGLIREGKVVEAASGALVDVDSPSLRLLAGVIPAESDRTRPLLDQSLRELGMGKPDAWTSFEIATRWRAEDAVAGRRDVRSTFVAIVNEALFAYFERPDAEDDPDQRPPDVQRLFNETEIADLLAERGSGFPDWLDARFMRHATRVLRAIAGRGDWPTSNPWEGVEWTGTEYRSRA